MKTTGMERYENADLERIANEYEDIAAQARAAGTAAPPEWDFLAKMSRYVVVLRTQLAGEKKPGLRQQAV